MGNKIIINTYQHNCSHCGTKGANYTKVQFLKIDENKDKCIYAMFLTCKVCGKISMHLLKDLNLDNEYYNVSQYFEGFYSGGKYIIENADIEHLDEHIIMSIPTPTFIIDAGIPKHLRDLLIEASKCIKENALTGASACIRKAIYQFLSKENASGDNYDDKIKSIKNNWPQISDYLDVLKGIKGITSDQVHEDSFATFSSEEAKLYISILEEIFREVYVIPKERKLRKESIMSKFGKCKNQKPIMNKF